MRKLILSLCVIAASGAYVVLAAMSSDGGLEGLLDRLSFRAAGRDPAPLDLDGPRPARADDLFTSISAEAAPRPAAATVQ